MHVFNRAGIIQEPEQTTQSSQLAASAGRPGRVPHLEAAAQPGLLVERQVLAVLLLNQPGRLPKPR